MPTPLTISMSGFKKDNVGYYIYKDPDDNLDYGWDLSTWLDVDGGEIISSSTWIVDLGITTGATSFDDTSTTIWFSGGTVGQTYEVTNRITTSGGAGSRTKDFVFRIIMRETT